MVHTRLAVVLASVVLAACSGGPAAVPSLPPTQVSSAPFTMPDHILSGTVLTVPRGTVWSPTSGTGVEGVLVETDANHSAVTDANGMFNIEVSGPVTISLSKPGYVSSHASTFSGNTVYIRLGIAPIPATHVLSGVVSEQTLRGSIPLAGVVLEGYVCDVLGHCVGTSAATDGNGVYHLSLADGVNPLWISKNGYATNPASLPNCDECNAIVTVDGDGRFDVTLEPRP